MSTGTGIEWTEATWNPVVGCTKVSAGCANCYAETMANRIAAMARTDVAAGRDAGKKRHYLPVINDKGRWSGKVELVPEALTEPLRWKKPRKVFVCSMSDLFHKDVPFEYIDKVMAVAALCPQHVFQVLTKRPERMAEYFIDSRDIMGFKTDERVQAEADEIAVDQGWCHAGPNAEKWPLPNVWLGASCEDQPALEKRVPELLKCPAAVRFLSCEPLLGPLDVRFSPRECPRCGCQRISGLREDTSEPFEWYCASEACQNEYPLPGIDWVIVGGESGRNARPCDVAWVRSVVEQCRAAGVACFVKQLGRYAVEDLCADLAGVHPTDDAAPSSRRAWDRGDHGKRLKLKDSKGGDMAEWPEDLKVREWPRSDKVNVKKGGEA